MSTREESPDPARWGKVVGLIQTAFCEGHLTEECTLQTSILVPKGNGDFLRVVLVEFLWKTLMWILNRCLIALIQFHNNFRGFHTGRGIGTGSLEAKPLQQLMVMR